MTTFEERSESMTNEKFTYEDAETGVSFTWEGGRYVDIYTVDSGVEALDNIYVVSPETMTYDGFTDLCNDYVLNHVKVIGLV